MAYRFVFALLVLLVGGALLATGFSADVIGEAVAAQPQKRPGIIERLFGPRAPPPRASSPRATSPIKRIFPTRKRSPPSRSTPRQSTINVQEVQPKDPNARKILVVGDYVGAGIAWGLDQALAQEPKLAVVDRTNGSSGLVRSDHYDWNEELLGILNEENPDIVVVALGANDRQEVRADKQRYPVRSAEWEKTYTQRIEAVADTLKVYGRPFFWVSTPPLRGEDATSDIAYFNGLYEPRVTRAGGHFIDVWNGFTNASGQYITTGPDIDGQVKALRTSDGIGFTSVGKQKLAYYVERDIRHQTGIGAGAADLLASASQTSTIEIGPDGKKRLVGPVISLSDPLPGASADLAGAPDPIVFDPVTGMTQTPPKSPAPEVKPEDETAQYKLVVKGQSLPGVAGRVDDFAWPPSQRANQAFVAPAPPLGAAADAGPAATSDGTAAPIDATKPN